MKFELRNEAGIAVIALTEKMAITSDNASEFRASLHTVLEQVQYRIVLDLENLEFIDSSGISVIISGLKSALMHDGFVYLLHVPQAIRKVFELIRLDRIMTIYDSAEQIQVTQKA